MTSPPVIARWNRSGTQEGDAGCIDGHSPGQTGCRDASLCGETLPTLTIRGDQLAFRVATDEPCDGEQGIGPFTLARVAHLCIAERLAISAVFPAVRDRWCRKLQHQSVFAAELDLCVVSSTIHNQLAVVVVNGPVKARSGLAWSSHDRIPVPLKAAVWAVWLGLHDQASWALGRPPGCQAISPGAGPACRDP